MLAYQKINSEAAKNKMNPGEEWLWCGDGVVWLELTWAVAISVQTYILLNTEI